MPIDFASISVLGTWVLIGLFGVFIKLMHKSKNEPEQSLLKNQSLGNQVGFILFYFIFFSVLLAPMNGRFDMADTLGIQWVLASKFIGYLMLFAGLVLYLWALWDLSTLRSILSTTPDLTTAYDATNVPLLQSGPYALIRQPLDLSQLLMWLGSALIFVNHVGLIIGIIFLLPLIRHRIRTEEKNLLAMNGLPYAEYRGRVGGLFPKIW